MRISDWSSDVCSSDLILRVLGNLFQLPGFDDETSESVRDSVLVDGVQSRLSNDICTAVGVGGKPGDGLERVADVPIYRTDAMVRRSAPLQETADSRPPQARMSAATLQRLGLESGAGRSEEHTSELQSLMRISYAVFCLE